LDNLLAHHISEIGEPLVLGANHPFELDQPDSFWMVERGTIDIFSVAAQDGKPVGRRSRLCRIHSGELFFPLTPRDGDDALCFLGVPGPDTRVIRTDWTHCDRIQSDADLADAWAEAIETWISVLSAELTAGRLVPKLSQEIREGEKLRLDPGGMVRSGARFLWVLMVEGTGRLIGRDDLWMIRPGQYVPLLHPAWIEAAEAALIRGETSTDLLREGITLHECLKDFHDAVFEFVRWERRESELSERARLRVTIDHDQQTMQGALTQLSSVLGARDTALEGRTPDVLFSACQIIGNALGIRILRPGSGVATTDMVEALNKIARASGFRIREVKLKGTWWEGDHGPILGRLAESGLPVALLQARRGRYEMHDPSAATKIRVDAAVSQTLDSRAFVFYRPLQEGPLRPWSLFRFGLFGCRKDLRLILLLAVGAGLLTTIIPIATGVLYDSVIPSANRTLLFQMVAGLAVGSFVAALFQLVQGLTQLRLLGRMEATLEAAVWDRLLNLPAVFFRRFSAGDLAGRAASVYQIQQMISGAVLASLFSGIFTAFNISLLFYFGPILGVVALAILFVAVGILSGLLFLQLRYQKPELELGGKISGLNLQILTNISKIRANASETRAFAKWSAMYSELKSLRVKYRKVGMATAIFQTALPLVASLAVFAALAATWKPDDPTIPTGQFLAFSSALTAVISSVMIAVGNLSSVLAIIPLYERMRPIVEQVPETQTARKEPGQLTGSIEMAHLNFRYKADGPLILKDLSLKADPGEFIALVGPSGSGKSTILRLLIGFETPESGSIFYDGQRLAELDIQSVRRQLGVVLQGGKLLSGDIFECIAGGSRLTMEDAWEAARMAALDQEIEAMPMGMHTVVGEGGSGLSGGQRQRLLIARAIVRKPRIVLFDEATSAMDNLSQAQVSASLEGLQATRIVIAHRLSTVRNADRIYVIVRGEIMESGSYDELMAKGGVFSELARRQIA